MSKDHSRLGAGGPLRLNLGCGSTRPPGWVHCDNSPGVRLARHPRLQRLLHALLPARMLPSPDWTGDVHWLELTRPWPFAADSASAIYASHVMEHLSQEEGQGVLAECRRVLAPGGVLRIVVPDLAALMEGYRRDADAVPAEASERFHRNSGYFSVPLPRGCRESLLFATRRRANHVFLYDRPALQAALDAAGFVAIEERRCGESHIPGIDALDREDRFAAAFCLEALRPDGDAPRPASGGEPR